jgi:hypothetical protein
VRLSVTFLAAVLALAGCGTPELTDEHMEQMSDGEAFRLLDCQSKKVYDDMGTREGNAYMEDVFDTLMKEGEVDGEDTMQEVLWEDGYTCPEFLE